jgi:hypothetical protein
VSWPVGRVLCTRLRGPAAIHLGLPLPAASSGLPASSGGPPSIARAGAAPLLPLDLAPGGVYRATQVTLGAGGLLHHRFTLTPGPSRGRFAFCGTIPRVAPGRRYRPPCPAEPGPSSARQVIPARRGRPASSPAAATSIRGQLAHGQAARGRAAPAAPAPPAHQQALGPPVSEPGCPAGCRTRRYCATAAARKGTATSLAACRL